MNRSALRPSSAAPRPGIVATPSNFGDPLRAGHLILSGALAVALFDQQTTLVVLLIALVAQFAGDLGASAAKKYDLEAWLPGQERFRELTSCSNTTDYQARRMQTRVRRGDGDLEVLHTLNGTATAMSRTLIAIMENHQRADGSVEIPATLHPYLPERAQVLTPKSSA